jgi:Zn-finger nucleic acid-binding protein
MTQKSSERERLKALHFMKCPKCGMGLIEIDYRGIKVDKCSACEGVWLDSGELDAVAGLEKSVLDGLPDALRIRRCRVPLRSAPR